MFHPNHCNLLNPFSLPKIPHFLSIQARQLSIHSSLLNFGKKPQLLQQLHARFVLYGLHQSSVLASRLIDSYANLGLLCHAKKVFNSVSNPNAVLCNSMLRSLSEVGEFKDALSIYKTMVIKSMYPDENTYPLVLKSCSCLLDVSNGGLIHGHVVKLGFESFESVESAMMEMYRSFGGAVKDLECKWNLLIFEALKCGNAKESFELYRQMRMERVGPDSATLVNMLRCCVELESLRGGRFIHGVAVVSGLDKHMSLITGLLSMYSKLGALTDVRLVFDEMPEKDCVVWNIMISACFHHGCPEESLELLRRMVKAGVRPDLFTVLPAVSSIRKLKSIEFGKQIHAVALRNRLDYQVSVHNSFIDMYCDCNCLEYARKIFDLVVDKTVVSWSSMIKGYVNHDRSLEALSLFSKMKLNGAQIDFITVINILPACVDIGALEQVKYLHGYSIKLGLGTLSSVNTAVFVSYSKCGCIEMARKLFDEENISKDVISWNSMITAYAKHGHWSQCFELYSRMKGSNLTPDEFTFLGLMTACVNSGLVKEGWSLFTEMKEVYNYQPRHEHYACMVDLLGRAGDVNGARELVKSMPFEPDARVWGPLLSACKMHSKTDVAEFAAENLLTMEPRNAGNYVLLSNIYAAAGKWDAVAKMRSLLRDKSLKKTPGCSWLEISGCVHEFRVADRSHPKSDEIYSLLGQLEMEIKDMRETLENSVKNDHSCLLLGRYIDRGVHRNTHIEILEI